MATESDEEMTEGTEEAGAEEDEAVEASMTIANDADFTVSGIYFRPYDSEEYQNDILLDDDTLEPETYIKTSFVLNHEYSVWGIMFESPDGETLEYDDIDLSHGIEAGKIVIDLMMDEEGYYINVDFK